MEIQISKKKFILVADDESEIIEIMKSELMQNIECQVVTAADGLEAFQKARNQSFNLIVTDFNMPRLNGADLIAAIRDTERNVKTPILIYTGYKEKAIETLNPKDSKIEILEKPATNIEMIEKCKNMLSEKYFSAKTNAAKTNLNFLETFIEATKYTLSEMAQLKNVKEKKVLLMNESEMNIDISATLSMKSSIFTGVLTVSFSEELFVKLVSLILGENIIKITDENHDAAAEILNIIFGQTKLRLLKLGFELEKAIPTVIVGNNHKIFTSEDVKSLVVPFDCECGIFYLSIGLKTKTH